ncbi:MAG: NAD(P)/FAD-dependent oxidoreductase [Pseudomonadota bacterium]
METITTRPRVLVIGAGFAGLMAVKKLARQPVDVTLIDRRNHHLFQPLLYQVATSDLAPSDVAWPIREIFSRHRNVTVVLAEVSDIDQDQHVVITDQGRYPFDYLVVACGAETSYFGRDDWAEVALGLKRIPNATDIRKKILVAFERAETADSTREQDRLTTFAVVGGGPTGVEMAGAIAELARMTLAKDFRHIDAAQARIVLIEAGPRLLSAFPEALSDYTQRTLERLGVEVMLDTRVTDITAAGVELGDRRIPAGSVIWGAGVHVPHAACWLGVETDRSGRVPVGPDLSLAGHPNIFVIGDAAQIAWQDGKTVPGLAPAAKQQGIYAAEAIAARVAGHAAPAPFRYRHMGDLATIGRHAAVISYGPLKLRGFVAWWLWGMAHIYFLIGVRKPLLIAINWLWSYLRAAKGVRLITGTLGGTDDPAYKPPQSVDAA